MKYLLDSSAVLDVVNILKSKKREKRSFTSKEFPKFIFICGKDIFDSNGRQKSREELLEESNKRYNLKEKLEKERFKISGEEYFTNFCILSEVLYDHNELKDLLTFEGVLGEISDKIIVILESEGTFCELGAFTYSDMLMRKLIVINDDEYENVKSFIRLGPLRKIELVNESSIIYTSYESGNSMESFRIKKMVKEISDLGVTYKPNKKEKAIELKNFIYEIMNIIEIFQPIKKTEIQDLYKEFTGFTSYIIKDNEKHNIKTIKLLLDLLVKMELVKERSEYYISNEKITFYNCLFDIDRIEYNKFRTKVCTEIFKNFNERMSGDYNEYLAGNE